MSDKLYIYPVYSTAAGAKWIPLTFIQYLRRGGALWWSTNSRRRPEPRDPRRAPGIGRVTLNAVEGSHFGLAHCAWTSRRLMRSSGLAYPRALPRFRPRSPWARVSSAFGDPAAAPEATRVQFSMPSNPRKRPTRCRSGKTQPRIRCTSAR